MYFPKDRATNRRKNFCFVTFATQQVISRPYMLVLRQCSHWRSFSFLPFTFERVLHFLRNPTQ